MPIEERQNMTKRRITLEFEIEGAQSNLEAVSALLQDISPIGKENVDAEDGARTVAIALTDIQIYKETPV